MVPTTAPTPTPPRTQTPLTPSLCFPPTALSTFLSRSRALVDDPISQHLSALSTPSRLPFDQKQDAVRRGAPSTSRIPKEHCAAWVRNSLLPAWVERETVMEYCSSLAAVAAATATVPSGNNPAASLDERIVDEPEPDERLDPYSARKPPGYGESEGDLLASRVREEREVEGIVRRRTLEVLRDRCESVQGPEGWRGVVEDLKREGRGRGGVV